jgi:hypothetical protein
MTENKTTTDKAPKAGHLPTAVEKAIAKASALKVQGESLALQALRAIGQVVAEGRELVTVTTNVGDKATQVERPQYELWRHPFESDSAFIDAVKAEVAKTIKATPENIRGFVSLGTSTYMFGVHAPELATSDAFTGYGAREALKKVAPVVNAVTQGKATPDDLRAIVDKAQALVEEGEQSSLPKAIVAVRDDTAHAADERIPSWYASLQSMARKLVGTLHLVKRGKADSSIGVDAFESALEYVQAVREHVDPKLFVLDSPEDSTEGWTLDRIKAMRASANAALAFVDNVESCYRMADDNNAAPMTVRELRARGKARVNK